MARATEPSHFFTDQGALCGAGVVRRWSLVESTTSCPACRELLDARDELRAAAFARSVAPLGTAGRAR